MRSKTSWIAVLAACLWVPAAFGQATPPRFKVIAFYTGKADAAHISFVNEARPWFARMAAEHRFSFESTTNWDNLNLEFLAPYQVVLFLDTRPDSPRQREAFRKYMENGGGWMGFHFAAFALTPSKYPQNWDWYHNEFLGAGIVRGQYLEAHLGHPPGGGHPAPRDRRVAGHLQERPQRMVQVGQ